MRDSKRCEGIILKSAIMLTEETSDMQLKQERPYPTYMPIALEIIPDTGICAQSRDPPLL